MYLLENECCMCLHCQFILEIQKQSTRKCSDVPVFIYPTPDSNARLTYTTGEDLIFSLYATSPGARYKTFMARDCIFLGVSILLQSSSLEFYILSLYRNVHFIALL